MLRTILRKVRSTKDDKTLLEIPSTYYDLAKTYLDAVTDNAADGYNKSWLMFAKYTIKEAIDIYRVEALVRKLLQNPEQTALNAWNSMALVRLLLILEKEGRMENVDQEKLKKWVSKIRELKWYEGELAFSAEFHGFYAALNSLKEEDPVINKILEKEISNSSIRPLLWVIFGLLLSSEKEKKKLAEDRLKKLAKDYKGIVEDSIFNKGDLDYMAIYLTSLAECSLYEELEEIYPKFGEGLSKSLLSSEWIIKAIRTARDIKIGRSEEDVVIIQPDEITIFYPKMFALVTIAINRTLHNKVVLGSPKYKKYLEDIRAGKVVPISRRRYYFLLICTLSLPFVFSLFTAVAFRLDIGFVMAILSLILAISQLMKENII